MRSREGPALRAIVRRQLRPGVKRALALGHKLARDGRRKEIRLSLMAHKIEPLGQWGRYQVAMEFAETD